MTGRRRAVLRAAALASAVCVTLAGCGTSGHQAKDDELVNRAYPVVAPGQAGSILQAVDVTRIRSVDPKDVTGKDPRLVGPFRELSLAQAKINAARKKKARTPAAIQRVRLLVPAQQAWPRFFVAVGDTRDESTYLLQVLTSPDARTPYGLWAQPVMLPGATLPEVAPSSTGAPVVSPDASGLVLAPKDVVPGYATYLNKRATAKGSENFRRSTYSDQIVNRLLADQKGLKAVATVASTHSAVKGTPFALRTADGGALVIGALTQEYTIKVKKGKGKVGVTDPKLAALAGGKKEFGKSFTRTATEVLVFRVPPRGGGPITVIAAQKGDVKAVAS
jgi:hypothetical protein